MRYFDQRPDKQFSYSAGYKSSTTKRLDAIEVSKNNQLYRRFILDYQTGTQTKQSQLTSVQECSNAACLPKVEFAWKEQFAGYESTKKSQLMKNISFATPVDLNGDGRQDLVTAVESGKGTKLYSYMYKNDQFELISTIALNNIKKQKESLSISNTSKFFDSDWTLVNYNGDEFVDLAFTRGNGENWEISLGNANGFDTITSDIGFSAGFIADMDGDGLTDKFKMWTGTQPHPMHFFQFDRKTSNEAGLKQKDKNLYWFKSQAPSFMALGDFYDNTVLLADGNSVFDFNGDGIRDIIFNHTEVVMHGRDRLCCLLR